MSVKADALTRVAPLLKLAPNWRAFLARAIREEDVKLLRAHGGAWTRAAGSVRRSPAIALGRPFC
jgi:hypothetical protein